MTAELRLAAAPPILQLEHFTKTYGEKAAIFDLTLALPAGGIVGLLGPNGSGKTTLLKTLAGLLQTYRGQVRICGLAPGTETKKLVSYLPDRNPFSPWMRPEDAIGIYRDFFADFSEEKCRRMMERFQISPRDKFSAMSKGTVEKFQLCLVMSRAARLYLLDEPIAGVDAAARDFVLDTILENYNPQGTILIATHLIADIERLFDTVIFLKEGRLLLREDADRLRAREGMMIEALFKKTFQTGDEV